MANQGYFPLQPQGHPDKFYLGGCQSPGIARFTKLDVKMKWMQNTGAGLSGAVTILQGIEVIKGAVTIELYDDEDWTVYNSAAWQKCMTIPTRLGPSAPSFEILHPAWNSQPFNIFAVVVESFTLPIQDDKGMYAYTLNLVHFKKVRPQSAPVTDSKTAAAPQNPHEKAIADKAQLFKSRMTRRKP